MPGPYQQGPGPYQQAPGPYAQAPGAYASAPGQYAQQQGPAAPAAPHAGPYQQAPTPGQYQQAPTPGPYQQTQPYSGPYQQAQPYSGPYQQAQPYGGPMEGCQICGAVPAAPVTVRGHQGMIVVMRSLRRKGTMCRTCGLATFREMQADTMVQGWWGPMSVVITPITLLINLAALSTIRRIPEPVAAGHRPPLNPGKSVFARPRGILGLIPLCLVLAVVLLAVIGMAAGSGEDDGAAPAVKVGACAGASSCVDPWSS